jgi:hypothetical protein
MPRGPTPSSTDFLGTLNRLSGAGTPKSGDAEQVKRMVLERLKQDPTDLQGLGELSLPMSAVQAAVGELHKLGLIELVPNTTETYRLSDYAAKALTFITPA